MNQARILGNTLAAFAAAAIGINLAGSPAAVGAAFYVAAITAVLALARELQEEGKKEDEGEHWLAHLLMF